MWDAGIAGRGLTFYATAPIPQKILYLQNIGKIMQQILSLLCRSTSKCSWKNKVKSISLFWWEKFCNAWVSKFSLHQSKLILYLFSNSPDAYKSVLGQAKAKSMKSHLSLLCGWQGPMCLAHLPATSQGEH